MASPLFAQWRLLSAGLTALLMTIAALFSPGVQPSTLTLQSLQNRTAITAATETSRNWSGYVATGGTFTSITGTWTIPQPDSSDHMASDAAWVGIGGARSQDLIQSGTENIINSNGQITFSAFYELLPDDAQPIPVIVNAGDSITVSISESSTNQWLIAFKDNTSGQSYTTTVSYQSSFSSADWVEEVPSAGHKILSLDNFGSIAFSGGAATENNSQVTIAQSNAQPIIMVNTRREPLATPSDLDSGGASFTVTRSDASSDPQPERRRHGWR